MSAQEPTVGVIGLRYGRGHGAMGDMGVHVIDLIR
jgi:hypothetical protein